MYTVASNKIYIHCKKKDKKCKFPTAKKHLTTASSKLLELYVILVYPYTNLYTAVAGRKGEKKRGKHQGLTVTSMYNSCLTRSTM